MKSDTWLQRQSRRAWLKHSAGAAAMLAAGPLPGDAAAPLAEEPVAPGLALPPFLSRPTGTSIRLSAYNGAIPGEMRVEVRRAGSANWRVRGETLRAGPREKLDWSLTGLNAGTRYEYRIQLQKRGEKAVHVLAEGSFHTQRLRAESYTAVLITDPHTGYFAPGSGPMRTLDEVVRNAARVRPEFVLDLGDNVAWAGSREYAQEDPAEALAAYTQYRRQIAPLSAHASHFAVLGNWVGESGKFPDKSIRLVGDVRRALLPGPNHQTYPQGGSANEDYYAFTWGDVLYILLNIQTYSKPSDLKNLNNLALDVNHPNEYTLGPQQMAWFENTLRRATQRFRFVCIHHPAGGNAGDAINTSYGRGGARAWHSGEQARIHALMKQHHVQIFFYGHDHVFVDDVVDGIHYTLPGSCGAPWKFTPEETGYERSWPDSGHAVLEVTPTLATVTFMNQQNDILHRFSVKPV